MHLSQREFERILIIKPSSFGDVIHALPVLNGLRQRYPQARISWMVAHSCAGLLDGHPALDEVIRFDRKRYGRLGRDVSASIEFLRFVEAFRTRQFELVVDLQGLFRSGFLAMASGARTRVGFANARELGWMFYSHRVDVPDPEMHAVDRNYLFGRLLGFADVPVLFNLPVDAEARRSMCRLLAEHGLHVEEGEQGEERGKGFPGEEDRGKGFPRERREEDCGKGLPLERSVEPYLVVGPGTRWETKQWPAEHFAAAIAQIGERTGLPVVLTGMPEERSVAEQVQTRAGGRIINLAGQTSLAEMIALIAGARAVLMHDSGPMHLATALNIPTVAIYGPTSPVRTGPYGRDETVARLELPCSPCYLKKVDACPHAHRCMRDLSPEAVADQVVRTLENASMIEHPT